jgi:broad specificity phosphatase PhoE
MKLIIVRHGQAEHNVHSLMVGHGDSILTDKGEEQVSLVAEKLRDEHIDAAYSSDLTRALHTAQGIMRHHPHVELNVTTALREVDMGELEGKTKAEFHSAVKKSGKRWFELAPKGGESMIDTRARAAEFIERLFLEQKGKTVLLVSHGGFIRALLAHILKHDFRTDQPLRIINTAVTVVEMRDDDTHVAHIINDASHLDDESRS